MRAEAFPWMIPPMKSKEQQHGTQVLNTTIHPLLQSLWTISNVHN